MRISDWSSDVCSSDLEAVDKMDPLKRESPRNQVLKTQGLGNLICGLAGGLTMTAGIVRSSTNVGAGGKTRMASVVPGWVLMPYIMVVSSLLNLITFFALSSHFLFVGYIMSHTPFCKRKLKIVRRQF